MTKIVLTYGTFDMFHIGHLNLIRRLKSFGSYLIVAVSTDDFNSLKRKKTVVPYEQRAAIVSAIREVDLVIPEICWEQKREDIRKYDVDIFAMGDDWAGKFDNLSDLCEVIYLPRTIDVSSTQIKILVRQGIKDKLLEISKVSYKLNELIDNVILKE
ncbi:adenylyltransferase/cytidyltransferase family protein [Rhodoferax antarcticus]|uniref:adenylyltransferase/cytidyltransferase family protein n=1 Tax=Rhodoferax antarcticus TaxID=81479 RepID=UPI002224A4ED|nr:adenylyltransferase/cytidyltransferase family protein [Rhodoferax antarcticus]MCW2314209.1 glycerol-3-phosphate cytidylyltransferase [Rhodoferax antarcticus]